MSPKKTKQEKQDERTPTPATPSPSPDPAARPLAEKIGFGQLDLGIEKVEERISPRETNVFDK